MDVAIVNDGPVTISIEFPGTHTLRASRTKEELKNTHCTF
jgi:hypothetical protein